MIKFIQTMLAVSPAALLILLLASLWSSRDADDGSAPAWLRYTVTAALAVFILLMVTGLVLAGGAK